MAEKTKRGMDDDKFQSIVRSRIQSAVDYVDSDLAPDRERATRFYLGDMKKEAPAPDGRSKVVSRDVRDTVQGIMPSLMRIFMSSEKVVEFQPYGPEDEESADQATDYCNFIVRNDNPGFMVLHSAFKDALIRKTGIVQVWWDKQERVIAKRFEGIDDETFALLMQEQEGSEAEVLDHEQDEQTGTHGFTIKAVKRKGKMCIAAVPPEELIIARDAASFDDAALIGRRSYRTVGELVAEGFDYEEMLNLAGDRAGADEEVLARNNGFDDSEDKIDPSLREVLWCDVFIRCDADGDGITEIHRVQTAGTNYKIKRRDLVDDHHFADFCPEPEPHRAIGESLADCLDDIQLIRTQLLRLSLDGLAQTVTPRLGYLTNGGVDVKQLLDNRVGGVVGMTRPDGVFPLTTDKGAAQSAMEGYRLMGEVRQERTGQNQASMGLEADALQSTSRIAASALVQAAQSRVEMIARIFAETGMRRIFKLLLQGITRYQDKERMVRLRGRWVPMDPRNWQPDMDVVCNVGTGNGNPEEKVAFLIQFLQIQQQIMTTSGPQNPWVDAEDIRHALEDLCEAANRPASRYLKTKDAWQQEQQQIAAQKQQGGGEQDKKDPAMLLAEAEMAKSQASIQNQQQKTQFDAQRELLKDDRDRDKDEAEIIIKCRQAGIDPMEVFSLIRQQRQATPSAIQAPQGV